MLISVTIVFYGLVLRARLRKTYGDTFPYKLYRFLNHIEIGGYILSILATILVFWLEGNWSVIFVSLIGAPLYWLASYAHQTHWRRWVLQGLAAFYIGAFCYFLMTTSLIDKDGQGLVFSLLTMGMLIMAHLVKHPTIRQWWKSSLYYMTVLVSIGTWILISHFEVWSGYTLLAMFITAGVYFMFALYHQRNVFSYVALVTLLIAYFSTITMANPLLEFEYYRYYALALGFILVGIGYLVQQRVTRQEVAAGPIEAQTNRGSNWLTRDLIQPFRFQQRFASPLPYIFSEPLYNIALLMTSLALLFDLSDYRMSMGSMVFYCFIFMIYPSRIWIYFVIMAATDGLLNLFTDMLPEKYHTWGLVFLSMGWFFVGTLVEELLDAWERRHPDSHAREKRYYARPFFHGAIFVNLILLRYYFGDLQSVFSPEGWKSISEEAFPILLTSFFYVLKMRVYVSKLWLYPGIITGTLGIYFGVSTIVPIEYSLLALTGIAFIWLLLGALFNESTAIQTYIREMVHHRLPNLEREGHHYRVHIHDFASPFYTFGFLLVCVILVFSAVLIPQQTLLFNREFEFALIKADKSLLYGVQIINFVLMTIFFVIYYPRKIPLLDGKFEKRPLPQGLVYMPILAATLAFLWIFSAQIALDNGHLYLALAALTWSVFIGIYRHYNAQCQPYVQAAHILGGLAMFFNLCAWNQPHALLILPILSGFYTLIFYFTHSTWNLYPIAGTLVTEAMLFPVINPDFKLYPFWLVPLVAAFIALGLFAFTVKRKMEHAAHYELIFYILGALALIPAAYAIIPTIYNGIMVANNELGAYQITNSQFISFFNDWWVSIYLMALAILFTLVTPLIREKWPAYLAVMTAGLALTVECLFYLPLTIACLMLGILIYPIVQGGFKTRTYGWFWGRPLYLFSVALPLLMLILNVLLPVSLLFKAIHFTVALLFYAKVSHYRQIPYALAGLSILLWWGEPFLVIVGSCAVLGVLFAISTWLSQDRNLGYMTGSYWLLAIVLITWKIPELALLGALAGGVGYQYRQRLQVQMQIFYPAYAILTYLLPFSMALEQILLGKSHELLYWPVLILGSLFYAWAARKQQVTPDRNLPLFMPPIFQLGVFVILGLAICMVWNKLAYFLEHPISPENFWLPLHVLLLTIVYASSTWIVRDKILAYVTTGILFISFSIWVHFQPLLTIALLVLALGLYRIHPILHIARDPLGLFARPIFWLTVGLPLWLTILRSYYPEGLWGWKLPVFVGATGFYAWLAYDKQKSKVWWLTAFLGNSTWLYFWVKVGSLQWQIWPLFWHLLFVPLGISLVLLAHFTIDKKLEKKQLYHLGLMVLLFSPLFSVFVDGSKISTVLYGLEFVTLATSFIILSLHLEIRAFLYTGAWSIGGTVVIVLGFLFLQNNWFLRWGLFIGLGTALIAVSTYIQVHREGVRDSVNRFFQRVQGWV